MSDKITLNSIGTSNSITTAAGTVNANNAVIVAAFDNTLSLNGLAPNQMQSNLDMNSNQILNLPAPVAANSPARLVDILSNPTLTLTIPPIGTSGSVVGLLNTSNTFSGANTFSGSNTFSTSNTFSSTTAFNGNVTINSSLPLTLISNSPGGSEVGLQYHDPNMVTTNNLILPIGRDESNYDRAQIGFYYVGLNSANNKGWLGLYGADHTINWDGNSFVGINTGTGVLTKRFAVGSNFTVDDSGNIITSGTLTASGIGASLGQGGTGASNNVITLNGASGTSGGSVFSFNKNGSAKWYVGESSAIYGTTSEDFVIFNQGTAFGANLVISATTNTVTTWGGLFSSSSTLGIGYSTGVGTGGTVTQATNKSTSVTLNTLSGQITCNNAALGAGTVVSFTLNNSAIAATDVLILNHVSGGTPGSYTLNAQCGTGSATINIRNNTSGSLGEAIVISYVLIKGSTN